MTLTKKDLREHVWLVLELRQAQRSPELEAEGFNYFSVSKATGKPLAWKLRQVRL
ncbi:MAG: hypothetical protein ACP5JN_04180 [Candidatus Micrarchaeia archaeon]